jgi:hypothetical protein
VLSKLLVCLAVLAGLSACSEDKPDNRPAATTVDIDDSAAPRPTEPTQIEGRVPTRKDLRGTWRPVSLFGEKETRTAIHGTSLDLRFGSQPEGWGWIAYDGCNWTSAFARLDKTGGFKSVSEPATTMRGCSGSITTRARNVEAVQGAKRIELRGPHLVLLDSRDAVIGEYVRSNR